MRINDILIETNKLVVDETENVKNTEKYMKSICQRLLPDYDFDNSDIRFLVSDDIKVDAFFHNPYSDKENRVIFVTKGLIKCCENEDQLAFVLGHELTHGLLKEKGEKWKLIKKRNLKSVEEKIYLQV